MQVQPADESLYRSDSLIGAENETRARGWAAFPEAYWVAQPNRRNLQNNRALGRAYMSIISSRVVGPAYTKKDQLDR